MHKLGFLGQRVVEFVPIKLLRQHDLDEWETRLLEHLKDFTAHDNKQKSVQRLYMEEAYKMGIYGCTFFRCNQKGAHNLPENVILGVQFEGIKIFDRHRALLASFRIEEVLRWGFKPAVMFYFEVNPSAEMDGTLEFDTVDGKAISDLLTDYALAFIQEKSHEDERRLGDLPEPPPQEEHDDDEDDEEEVLVSPAVVSPRAAVKGDWDFEGYDEAATRIQALARGKLLRKEWQREDAAIHIQAVFRGHKGRLHVSNIIEEMIANGEFEDDEDFTSEDLA